MKHKIISFDLQGTLTNAAFSDEFWLEYLPKRYSQVHGLTFQEGKKQLGDQFQKYGKYDYRYYSVDYWLRELQIPQPFSEIVKGFKHSPYFYPEMATLVEKLSQQSQLIIITTTTYDFINIELAKERSYFKRIFSSLDDLHIAGKTPEVFLTVANLFHVSPEEIIHIGNSKEMDIQNAQKAGLKAHWYDESQAVDVNIQSIVRIFDLF